jgi:hypothetical protein
MAVIPTGIVAVVGCAFTRRIPGIPLRAAAAAAASQHGGSNPQHLLSGAKGLQ